MYLMYQAVVALPEAEDQEQESLLALEVCLLSLTIL